MGTSSHASSSVSAARLTTVFIQPATSLERAANSHLPRYANVSDRTLLRYVSGSLSWMPASALTRQAPGEIAGDRRQPYPLLRLARSAACRCVRVVGRVPRLPGEARAALGVQRREHQAAEQAEVLEEVGLL